MTISGKFLVEYKKGLFLVCVLCAGVIIIELFIFNGDYLIGKAFNLQERRYSINDGGLYKFNLENGKLIAQNNDPNITFNNINRPIASIVVKCTNSNPMAVGQVFYRSNSKSFTEARSVRYDASLPETTLILTGIPLPVMVSSLRFDLTDTPGDSISCSEFVINPHIPFNLNRLRLAGYTVLLLLVILIIFRNFKPVIYIRSPKVILILIFLVLSFIFWSRFVPLGISQNLIFIVVLCILLFSFAITYALSYLYTDSGSLQAEKKGVLERYKHEIAIAAVILITTLPLLTESYFYYDDWWTLGINTAINKGNLISLGRPLQTLIHASMDFVNIRNAYLSKWVFLPAIILYAIILYRWLYTKTQDDVFSFFLACILSVFAPAMDLLGYTATSAFCYSILFSALSIICFEHAWEVYQVGEKKRFIANAMLAFVLLFTSLLAYQIGPQIVFLFLSIDVYFSAQIKPLLKKYALFLFLFAAANGFYLLFVKFLNRIYLVEITTNRSQIINSLSQIVAKTNYYQLVVEQSVMQIIAAFSGNSFILERYHGYFISFSTPFLGNMAYFFVIVVILAAFVNYWFRAKTVFGILILFVFIPMSDFVFLVLSENGYLTYYAFAHISLLMFYLIMGFVASVRFLLGKTRQILGENNFKEVGSARVVAPLLVMCALISNYYVRDFYVNYNSSVYNFVKNSIQTGIESGNIKRIHINGLISPINADVYSRFIVETALKDLGENVADYKITFSRNRYFLARIQESDYLEIRKNASRNDRSELDKLYSFEPTYRQYYIKSPPSNHDQVELQRIFMAAGAIPQTSSPNTLIIDLTWTDGAYFNRSERRGAIK